jgi:hypothetical protein
MKRERMTRTLFGKEEGGKGGYIANLFHAENIFNGINSPK